MRRWLSCAVLCLPISSAVTGAVPFAYADESVQQAASQAVVRGRVLDSSSAAIAGAHVTATSDRPGAPASAMTNQQGEFEITLTPGRYTVRVIAKGFAEASRRITVSADTAGAADFTLAVAAIQEEVSVAAAIGYSTPA